MTTMSLKVTHRDRSRKQRRPRSGTKQQRSSKMSPGHRQLAVQIYVSLKLEGQTSNQALTQTAMHTSQLQPIPRRKIWCHSGSFALCLQTIRDRSALLLLNDTVEILTVRKKRRKCCTAQWKQFRCLHRVSASLAEEESNGFTFCDDGSKEQASDQISEGDCLQDLAVCMRLIQINH